MPGAPSFLVAGRREASFGELRSAILGDALFGAGSWALVRGQERRAWS